MLTVQDVAEHWRQTPAAVRARIDRGDLRACRIAREFRIEWPDVWANEAGPLPRGANRSRYMEPLLTKADLAGADRGQYPHGRALDLRRAADAQCRRERPHRAA